MTLIQAFGYSVLATALIVSCVALSDRAKERRESEATATQPAAQTPTLRLTCEKNGIPAFVMSQDFVRDRLKAPATARFPSITDAGVGTTYLGGCEHRVVAYVDSQNSFGALLRSRYVATLREDVTTGRWTLKVLEMRE
jgi:hypothetical protein